MNNNAAVRASGGGRKRKTSDKHKSSLTRINPPDELIDQVAVRVWKTQSKVLIERGTFEIEDAPLLVAYCNSFALMLQAEAMITDKEAEHGGLAVPTSDGSIKKSPYVNVRADAISHLTRTGSLLGLDPLTRIRMMGAGSGGDEPGEGNEFDRF
ncbi:phage terminase small subunit P27 family [Marinobacter adhaerens]|uniref:Phage terminase small subunit P27 family n=1 Tax=Marinobacter adhaerens TaxID=1033846 RepID=A0A851HXA9_9GAMM|nr:phage terminase small subunit P27 family [Marinobacter adhaerens]